jgi:hypothetical protein
VKDSTKVQPIGANATMGDLATVLKKREELERLVEQQTHISAIVLNRGARSTFERDMQEIYQRVNPSVAFQIVDFYSVGLSVRNISETMDLDPPAHGRGAAVSSF